MTAAAKQRVVVADDSRLMRRMLSDALGRQGFDVVATAADGDGALAACREHRPDALTLDHELGPAIAREANVVVTSVRQADDGGFGSASEAVA